MAYKALYRKYRPDNFDVVVGQKHIIKTLQNAIESNKVAHAYIFSGPRGTGKTTTAKLLAKALNCSDPSHKPCNKCENCIAINEGRHPDIIEIDAASNNGVDEIRDLIEKVKYAPIQGKYKVYIIDEVHMLTPGAFNALLKTLEEPPEHVIFILATTDVHKVLPTVLSRCQRFDFSKIDFADIKDRVIDVLNQEKITFEKEVPTLIAELADGGMRDALSILDQVISYAGEQITLQHVYDIYGMMSNQEMVQYLTYVAKGETKQVLNLIEQYIGKGIDVKRLTYDLMICLKDAIVYHSTKDETILERLNASYSQEILKYYTIDNMLKVTDILNEARGHYRLSTNYRLFFELASLKIIECLKEKNDNLNFESAKSKEVLKENTSNEKQENKIVESVKKVEEKPIEVEIPIQTNNSKNTYNAPLESEIISYPIDEYINILCQGDKKFKEMLNERFKEIRKYTDNVNYRYIAQLLVDAVVGVANSSFALLVYDFKILASRAKQRNNLILIHNFIKEIFGYNLEIYVVDRPTFVDLTQNFFQLRQANKLPSPHPIPLLKDLPKKEVEIKQSTEIVDETIEIGKELFGNDLKIK